MKFYLSTRIFKFYQYEIFSGILTPIKSGWDNAGCIGFEVSGISKKDIVIIGTCVDLMNRLSIKYQVNLGDEPSSQLLAELFPVIYQEDDDASTLVKVSVTDFGYLSLIYCFLAVLSQTPDKNLVYEDFLKGINLKRRSIKGFKALYETVRLVCIGILYHSVGYSQNFLSEDKLPKDFLTTSAHAGLVSGAHPERLKEKLGGITRIVTLQIPKNSFNEPKLRRLLLEKNSDRVLFSEYNNYESKVSRAIRQSNGVNKTKEKHDYVEISFMVDRNILASTLAKILVKKGIITRYEEFERGYCWSTTTGFNLSISEWVSKKGIKPTLLGEGSLYPKTLNIVAKVTLK